MGKGKGNGPGVAKGPSRLKRCGLGWEKAFLPGTQGCSGNHPAEAPCKVPGVSPVSPIVLERTM